ncbi:ATP-binding protein [Chitinophaga sp. Cy-1792]|uniref:ATP-binding protein n=1 Tax=Chitinophaga sp. Cy-1792 TaxID=2608339 RepID=UPI0014227563|nr:ATP-binding protein [Chitinophaga sp. Cy-1792]NIG54669.1 ATP-binding protein [Chitinophaga sp. Cy-1792]
MKEDYSRYKTRIADPVAPRMLNSLRAVGYTLGAALADILDNSISAEAKNIWIDFNYSDQESFISIEDDGRGMNDLELEEAMRLGSRIPDDERLLDDLGRFGMGLKTASLSQCKSLSVMSKKNGEQAAYLTWDLDFICNVSKKWELLEYMPEGDWVNRFGSREKGTTVLWKKLDRIIDFKAGSYEKISRNLEAALLKAKDHLAMVFHRFIEDRQVKIYLRGREIEPWNPFLTEHSATQHLPEEILDLSGTKLRGFILPHQSRLTVNEFNRMEGGKGWNGQQGFYIYRNKRLLIGGSWLGLLRKNPMYRLARISLDFPASLDAEWQIDIKKSTARFPPGYINRLKAYANAVCSRSSGVFTNKGAIIRNRGTSSFDFQPVWMEKQKFGNRFYEINRHHPIIVNAQPQDFMKILKLLEETVPVNIQQPGSENTVSRPFEGERLNELKEIMLEIYQSLMKTCSSDDARSQLFMIEPFNEYPEIIASL